jgi:segregation and condensation protein A
MSYKIKLDIFEGPFDLLVYLIENARMSVYDIQVSEITGQYIRYVEEMKSLDVSVATEFMVLAAALIEIKSKMLLPRMKADGDGFLEEDPRAELVQKILEYKRFKSAAELLEQEEEQTRRIFEKPKEDLTVYTREADEYLNLDLKQFVRAFHLFLQKKKRIDEIRANYTRVERQKVTIDAKIEYIRNLFRFKGRKRLNFRELLPQGSDRYEVILTFVSMLEMIRQKTVSVRQNVNFGEIILSLSEKDKPGGKGKPEEGENVS